MRAHTATHILHAALIAIFPQTKQAGSYVGPDEVRFDFFADRLLENKELESLTKYVNSIIQAGEKVITREMPYEEAIEAGAKAFFEEKYPELVRVVSIGELDPSGEWANHSSISTKKSKDWSVNPSIYSVELCGGTHVDQTGEIGSFIITEQTTVAAWVKRIVALTWPRVAMYALGLEDQLATIAHKLWSPVKQLNAKLDKILKHYDEQSQLIDQLSANALQYLSWESGMLGDQVVNKIGQYEQLISGLGLSFSEAVAHLKWISDNWDRFLRSETGQYALSHPEAKNIINHLWRKGGGSDIFVQWKNNKIIQDLKINS